MSNMNKIYIQKGLDVSKSPFLYLTMNKKKKNGGSL